MCILQQVHTAHSSKRNHLSSKEARDTLLDSNNCNKSVESWLDTDVEESDLNYNGSEDDDNFTLHAVQQLTSPLLISTGASGNRFSQTGSTGGCVQLRLCSYVVGDQKMQKVRLPMPVDRALDDDVDKS